ncbi:MAG: hypothetical protein R3B54_15710 [Bdellovibrionota bacterium]
MTYVKGRPDPIESAVRQIEIIDLPLPAPPTLSPKIEIEIDAHFDAPHGVRHSFLSLIQEALAATKAKKEQKKQRHHQVGKSRRRGGLPFGAFEKRKL